MSYISIEEALRTLTQNEITVLYWKCRGLKYEEIGELLNYGVDWVQMHMSNTYAKLGFDSSMHWTKRAKILKETHCPTLAKIIDRLKKQHSLKNAKDVFQYWPPDPPDSQPNPYALALVIEDENREIEYRKQYLQRRQNRSIIIRATRATIGLGTIALIVICCIVVAAGTYWFGTNMAIPYITEIAAANASITQSPAIPGEPTDARPPTAAILPTDRPRPTSTTAPIPTSTEPFVPPADGILFQDNFDNGLSPEWQVVSGKPAVANGHLTSASNSSWLMVGDPRWTNYKIEFYVYDDAEPSYIGIHAQDIGNMVALKWYFAYCEWNVVADGDWLRIKDTYDDNVDFESSMISLSVTNNTYSAFGGGRSLSSFWDSTYSQGMVALKLTPYIVIDDLIITYIP
ncbi:hypothetical protein ACFLZW_04235 [Chloroflexota bacterium]